MENNKETPIQKLVLQNKYPFKEQVIVQKLNKINIFFGANGVGKTNISDFFGDLNKREDNYVQNERFKNFYIHPEFNSKNDKRIFIVFNHNFVDDTFSNDEEGFKEQKNNYINFTNEKNKKINVIVKKLKNSLVITYTEMFTNKKAFSISYIEIKEKINVINLNLYKVPQNFNSILNKSQTFKGCTMGIKNHKKQLKKKTLFELFGNFYEQNKNITQANSEDEINVLTKKVEKLSGKNINNELEKLNEIKTSNTNLHNSIAINSDLLKEIKLIFSLLDQEIVPDNNVINEFKNKIKLNTEDDSQYTVGLKTGGNLFNALLAKKKLKKKYVFFVGRKILKRKYMNCILMINSKRKYNY